MMSLVLVFVIELQELIAAQRSGRKGRRSVMAGLKRLKSMACCLAICSATGLAVAPWPAAAQNPPAIYLDQSADRDSRLLEAAKKEGTLTLYTSLATTE